MKGFKIIDRELTLNEIEFVNLGFDKLYIDEGLGLEQKKKFSFVVEYEDNFMACVIGQAHINGDTYSGWFHLTDLYVKEDFRNMGVGSWLLDKFEMHLKFVGILNIWLWTSGEPTLRFYKRHGYKVFTEMEKWYSDGSSRFGMRKDLIK